MKNILLILLTILTINCFAQLPYTWTAGVNPGWVSSDGVLRWQGGCGVVTTNCAGNYSNNQNTYYTSGTINASCASSLGITFTASGNAEARFDFLFVEYSLDNGITWINPYGVGFGWSGNFFAGTTIPTITTPTSATFKFRFNFFSDNSTKSSGYKITDFDIWCISGLPIELISFKGEPYNDYNLLKWITASETNNDYFTIERSFDAIDFQVVGRVDGAGNSTSNLSYSLTDMKPYAGVTYYRLKQTDYNGDFTISDMITVSRITPSKNLKVIRITNLLGQEVMEDYAGVKIYYFNDGSTIKKYDLK